MLMSTSNCSSKTLLAIFHDCHENKHMETSPGSTSPGTGTDPPGDVLADPEKALPTGASRGKKVPRSSKALSSRPSIGGFLSLFRGNGPLRPFKLLKSDLKGRGRLWHTDWFFNQLILASAVYVFFTNLLPGITFASDLYALTGKHYGAIEVVFSTGLCGIIFAL